MAASDPHPTRTRFNLNTAVTPSHGPIGALYPVLAIISDVIEHRGCPVDGDPAQPSPLQPSRRIVIVVSCGSRVPSSEKADVGIMGDVIRKTLPARIIPAWLDPLHVDVADPRSLPKCWFGVPFVSDLVFGYVEPGDFDIFGTWARLDVWFKEQSRLQSDWILVLVWGERFLILTFWSNHELLRITKEMWGQVCDLIDDMGYGPEYVLAWYLDRDLEY